MTGLALCASDWSHDMPSRAKVFHYHERHSPSFGKRRAKVTGSLTPANDASTLRLPDDDSRDSKPQRRLVQHGGAGASWPLPPPRGVRNLSAHLHCLVIVACTRRRLPEVGEVALLIPRTLGILRGERDVSAAAASVARDGAASQ